MKKKNPLKLKKTSPSKSAPAPAKGKGSAPKQAKNIKKQEKSSEKAQLNKKQVQKNKKSPQVTQKVSDKAKKLQNKTQSETQSFKDKKSVEKQSDKKQSRQEKQLLNPIPVAVSSAVSKIKVPSKKNAKTLKPKKEDASAEEDFLIDDSGDDSEIAEYAEELSEIDEIDNESEELLLDGQSETKDKDDEVVLLDAEGRRYCRAKDCDQSATVDAYCRFHYLVLWKKIQIRRKILADGKLERYVEELTARYPDKFLEVIRKDLRTEKDFSSAIQELEIDESAVENDFEEDTQYIDEVRGLSESGVGSSSADDEF